MQANKYSISKFICPECKKIFPLPRLQSKKRKKGHIKDLWCPYCHHVVKTMEIRTGDAYIMSNGKIIY